MLSDIWQIALIKPILNSLFLFDFWFGNLGLAIIFLTLLIKTILVPANIPSIKFSYKKQELDDELNKIKKKYKDKTEVAQKQMDLYKKHGINPASGCLPNILQLLVLIALYRVFMLLLNGTGFEDSLFYFSFLKDIELNTNFLYLDLTKFDPLYILPVLAAGFQFLMSRSMLPLVQKGEEIAKETPDSSDDVMYNMQQQMMFIAPIMTIVVGSRLPSGLVLYWFISSVYSYLQNIILKKIFNKSYENKN